MYNILKLTKKIQELAFKGTSASDHNPFEPLNVIWLSKYCTNKLCIYNLHIPTKAYTQPFHFQASLISCNKLRYCTASLFCILKIYFHCRLVLDSQQKTAGGIVLSAQITSVLLTTHTHMHSTLNIYKEDKKARFERVLSAFFLVPVVVIPALLHHKKPQRSKQTCTCVNTRFIHIMGQITKDTKP
jgi:hypothetical protein